MGHHVGKNAAHVLVSGCVKNLLALPLRPQDAARAQQPQVMAHQRLRQMRARSDVGDAARLLKAGKYDLQTACLAENPEQLGQLKDLIIGDWQKRAPVPLIEIETMNRCSYKGVWPLSIPG